jgi:hypothetical protein
MSSSKERAFRRRHDGPGEDYENSYEYSQKGICHWAASYGDDKLVIKMLDTSPDVNKVSCEASTPLTEAATEGGVGGIVLYAFS